MGEVVTVPVTILVDENELKQAVHYANLMLQGEGDISYDEVVSYGNADVNVSVISGGNGVEIAALFVLGILIDKQQKAKEA